MFLGHVADDGGPWSHRDRELAKALLIYEGSQCDGCGQPSREAQDPDKLGWYNVEPVICVACNAREKAAADLKNIEPGTRWRVSLDPGYVRRT